MTGNDDGGEVRGVVVLAQEDRLRIQTEDGRSLLFVLGVGVSPGIAGIEAWARTGQSVAVRYRGQPDAGAVALSVRAV